MAQWKTNPFGHIDLRSCYSTVAHCSANLNAKLVHISVLKKKLRNKQHLNQLILKPNMNQVRFILSALLRKVIIVFVLSGQVVAG